MSLIAGQFGHPRGLLGRFIGRGMVRSNGDFNRWFVGEIGRRCGHYPARIAELGPGPGVGLEEILRTFPGSHVWGIDPSRQMLAQSRRRNFADIQSRRLVLLEGGARRLQELAPLDLVLASHVLYFWHHPASELGLIRGALCPGGWLALGYQLKANMPPFAQKNFPRAGHVLYETDADLVRVVETIGFEKVEVAIRGPHDAPEGRLALAENRGV